MALMLQVEKEAQTLKLPIVGHCTDSASASLSGLVKLASPKTFKSLLLLGYH